MTQFGLAAQLWQYVEAMGGADFTSADVAAALPQLSRSGIRSELYRLVVAGKLVKSPAHTGYRYRQLLEAPACGFALSEVLQAWARARNARKAEEQPEPCPA